MARLGAHQGHTRREVMGVWSEQPKPAPATEILPRVSKTPVPPPPCPFCMLMLSRQQLHLQQRQNAPDPHRPSQVSGHGTHRDSQGSPVVSNMPRRSCTQRATTGALEVSVWFTSGVHRGCRTLGPTEGPMHHCRSPPSRLLVLARDTAPFGALKGPLQRSLDR